MVINGETLVGPLANLLIGFVCSGAKMRGVGRIDTFPSAPLLYDSTEEDGHNLMTEIPTILFPAAKDFRIGELFESLLGLIR